jgi:uncharacterized protein YkwD
MLRRYAVWLLVVGLLVGCSEPLEFVDIEGAARITSFTASAQAVTAGEQVILTWTVVGDAPLTLTLQPDDRDVTGQTSIEVVLTATTTYLLKAENAYGEDEAEVRVEVLAPGEVALEVTVSGLPAGAEAYIAVTNHADVAAWVSSSQALSGLAPGDYTIAAASVTVSGAAYLPTQWLQTVTLGQGAVSNVMVRYQQTATPLYQTPPDIPSCAEGTLSQETKDRALGQLNFLRVLLGLPPVNYDAGSDVLVQRAALISVANNQLSHFPPADWHCYSAEGATGAATSNLAISGSSNHFTPSAEGFIVQWANSMGHRRWLLDPFLAQTAVGIVHGTPLVGATLPYVAASALRVIYPLRADLTGLGLEFIAYPRGDFPSEFFTSDRLFSFSVLANTGSRRANGPSAVDFSRAQVSVEDSLGTNYSVTGLRSNYEGFGLPNHLQWEVPDLRNNVRYTVTVTGVRVNGEARTYRYEVRLR